MYSPVMRMLSSSTQHQLQKEGYQIFSSVHVRNTCLLPFFFVTAVGLTQKRESMMFRITIKIHVLVFILILSGHIWHVYAFPLINSNIVNI